MQQPKAQIPSKVLRQFNYLSRSELYTLESLSETDRGYELTTKEVRRKVQLWVRELRSTNHLLPPTELDIEEILKQPPNTIKGYVSPVPPDIILFPSEVCNFWGGVLSVFGFESTFPFWLGKG
eukprot:TRINITY_DN5809_c0_g1_i6.p1 TRINITY_DN5809_c0_g1~~TRINITY_DN5809_c0_g1_i6.p1  ORF type:complete len:123 (+),score=24.64 TRINITY_DN5809_c0_g1_i6:194-562(+)